MKTITEFAASVLRAAAPIWRLGPPACAPKRPAPPTPAQAKKHGEHYFIIERLPQAATRARDDRGGRRGGRGGERGRGAGGERGAPGGRGGPGGGPGGAGRDSRREPRSGEVPPGGGGWM